MKRILTVQDISCVGKCSATVALPIISAAGVEAALLPTAVLSTHTAFPAFTFKDLTEEMTPISDTFRKLSIDFDALYTGYLGSFDQLAFIDEFIEEAAPSMFVLIDPVMADNGVLYKGFTQAFADRMATICAKADLIIPNLTEASFMLHIPYRETYDEAYIREVLVRLTDLGAPHAAITGVCLREGKIGVYAYHKESGEYYFYDNDKLPQNYHGTGDVYASAVLGGLMRGLGINEALRLGVEYTLECMRCTERDPEHRFYGVNFEQALPLYMTRLDQMLRQNNT